VDRTRLIKAFGPLTAAAKGQFARSCIYIVLMSGVSMPLTLQVCCEGRAAVADCRSADASYELAARSLVREPNHAISVFRRLAIAGHARAQEALARQLDYGFNVPQNQIGAYIWYSIISRVAAGPASSWSEACLNFTDNRDAASFTWRVTQRRDELASRLRPTDLSAANRAAQSWTPGVGDPTQTLSVAAVPPSPADLPTSHPSQPLDDTRRSLPNAEEIPLQRHGNTYSVPVRINGTITLPFVLDTGATDLVIPADVALTLIRAGALTSSDFIGKRRYSLANGSEEVGDRVIIREVQVGQHAVRNVTAIVNPPASDLLLGQSFLSKFGTVTLDYRLLVLVLSP
jgi:clan AA aspartic protease (TIGR02281 family)